MNRVDVFGAIKDRIQVLQVDKDKPVRVAINGIEGAGKTTFAIALVEFLVREGVAALHVSIEGYHHPKAYRYRQGRDSADGYYEDAYQETAFAELVLQASQEDTPRYVPAIHDLETDEVLPVEYQNLAPNTVIITDGAYLLKPSYNTYWDLRVYLHVPFEVAQERGVERDHQTLGGQDQAREKYESRYHAASQRYLDECEPQKSADIVIDNSSFEEPKMA